MEIKDMDYGQFLSWATGYFILQLGRGESVRTIVGSILNNFLTIWLQEQGWRKIVITKKTSRKEKK
jgi:hypothetical protein